MILLALTAGCQEGAQEQPVWKDIVLEKIRYTDRISSNHYASMVFDKEGNTYVSCFYKDLSDRRDRVYVVKADIKGRTLWEAGGHSKGRATDIAMGPDGHLYITGIFNDTLALGERRIIKDFSHGFIARMTTEGEVLDLVTGGPDIFPTDIAVNKKGEVMISGVIGGVMTWDDVQVALEREVQSSFLLFLDTSLTASRGTAFPGLVTDAEAMDSAFAVTGHFSNRTRFAGNQFKTSSYFDQDGFIIKASTSKDHWMRTFGRKGVIDPAYRTSERGAFLEARDGKIFVLGLMDPEPNVVYENAQRADACLWVYSDQGQLMDQNSLMTNIAGNSILTMCMNGDDLWVSAMASAGSTVCGKAVTISTDPQLCVLHFKSGDECPLMTIFQHGANTSIRDMALHGDRWLAVGHAQESIGLDSTTLHLEDRHALFFLSASPD